MQHIRGKLSRALFMVLGLLMGFALKSYGEVRFGDAYIYNTEDGLTYSDYYYSGAKNLLNNSYRDNSLALEITGWDGKTTLSPKVVVDSINANVVGTPSIKTINGKTVVVVPISRVNNHWGGLPSFSLELEGLNVVSDTYYLELDPDVIPTLKAKDIFGLECTQNGAASDKWSGFKMGAGFVYSMTSEACKGISPNWKFQWNKKGTVSMNIKVPEKGRLVIRNSAFYNEAPEWEYWKITGTGVEEEGARPTTVGSEIKLNCESATTVTITAGMSTKKFKMSDIAFYPAEAESVHVVADFIVSQKVSQQGGNDYYPLYLNGYATGGGTYKAGETLKMVAHPAPGFALDHWEITDQGYWESTSTISFPEGTSTVSETLSFEVPESFCGSMEDEKVIRIRPIFVESNSVPAEGWPEWALGTWAGQILNVVPDKGQTYDGFYKLTLSETDVYEFYRFNDDDEGAPTNAWNNVKITEQEDCHIVVSCWYWSDSGKQKFDATMVLRKDECNHYDKSSCSAKNREDINETVDVKELAKLEMNTAPAERWPEWVLGNWTGPLDIWIPDQDKTYYGYSVFALDSTTNQWKVIWDDDDPDRDDSLLGWKIKEQADCHIVATAWCWDEDGDRVYDVECVFCKPDTDCADYDKSIAYIKERNNLQEHNDGECETGTMSLTKDEDNISPVGVWPEWVLGTWKGKVVNIVPHADGSEKVLNGTYALELTSTGSKEKYEFEGEDPDDWITNDMKGWKITEKEDCHIVATAWCWDDEKDDKFDATYVFCNPNVKCSHHANSTFYQEMRKGGDTVECENLVRDIRVICHYTNIVGVVGRELRKPNGDHYFGVDWFDYDTAPAAQISVEDDDRDPTSISKSGWLAGDPSTFDAAYKQEIEEKPTDTQSWYNDWASYHPIIVTPTKEGVYNFTMKFTWADGHKESITIKFDIKSVPTVDATAENVSAVYDGAARGIEVKVTSPTDGVTVMYSAESAEGPWQSTSPTVTEVGTTKIWYYALAEDYLGVTNSATVTISPRKISDVKVDVTLPDVGYYKYDGEAKVPAATVTDDSFAGFEDSDYVISYTNNTNAGEAQVIVTGSDKHYSGAVTNTFKIVPREVTLTSGSKEWSWDGNAKSYEGVAISGDGFVESEGVTCSDYASVAAPGTYDNTFKYTFNEGTLECNYTITPEYGKLTIYNYKATEKADGTIMIDGLGGEPLQSTELSIPEMINGKPVTEVKEQAFVNSKCGVETLKLSKYCKKIGASAFRGIKSLKKVIFVQVYNPDDTLTTLEVGAYAFGSSEVEEVVVPEYVSEIGDYAFSNCSNLRKVSVKAGTIISEKAFYRSGLNVNKKPEVISFNEFTYAGNTATMKVTSTGGTIVLTNLKIYFSEHIGPDANWEEVAYDTSDIMLTDTGCEVSVTATVPETAVSGYFTAVLSE